MSMKYIITKSQDNHVIVMELPKNTKIDTKTDRQISLSCLNTNVDKGIFTDITNKVDADARIWMLTEDIA